MKRYSEFSLPLVISIVILTLTILSIGCGATSNSSNPPAGAGAQSNFSPTSTAASSAVALGMAEYSAENGAYAAVAVYSGNTPVTNATVSVDGTPLPYGLNLTYQSTVFGAIPVYVAAISATPGSDVSLSVKQGGASIYSAQTKIPGLVNFSNPTQGQNLSLGQNLAARWTSAANAAGYFMDYTGSSDAYYGVFTTGTSWTVPSGALQAGSSIFTVSALSNAEGLTDGAVYTAQDDSEQSSSQEDSDQGYASSGWLAYTMMPVTAQIARSSGNEARVSDGASFSRAMEGLSVAQSSYVTQQGVRLKQNQYNPIQAAAQGNITFTLRFERWCISVGGTVLIDGATGQEKFKWSNSRIFKSERKKYGFSIPARQGDVLVIFEKNVDTIWGPTFNY